MKTTEPKQNSSFKWTSRIIGFMWMFLTACFAILNIFVFVQPQWIGDTLSSPRAGHFGLYSYCVSTTTDTEFDCQGTWTNFGTILNGPFAAATFFVGFSVLLILICLGLFICFLFLRARIVYLICGIIQVICTVCLFLALFVYPAGFDNDTIRSVCGPNVTSYYIDTCHVRWAYILAIIAFFNILILAILAFLLALKQPKTETIREVIKTKQIVTKYGELNEAFDGRTFQRH
jgi:LHFPL tetraspan subfamily member protein